MFISDLPEVPLSVLVGLGMLLPTGLLLYARAIRAEIRRFLHQARRNHFLPWGRPVQRHPTEDLFPREWRW